MCDKPILENPHALEFVPECYKTQKMRDEALNTYLPTIKFVPE